MKVLTLIPRGWALMLAVSVICLAGPVVAEEPTESAAAGKVVVYDTPTAAGISAEQEAQLRAFLAPPLNRSDEGLVSVVDPDGGISLDPQGRFQSIVLARINEDGEVEVASFDELEPAMGFLTFQTVSPLPADREIAAE